MSTKVELIIAGTIFAVLMIYFETGTVQDVALKVVRLGDAVRQIFF